MPDNDLDAPLQAKKRRQFSLSIPYAVLAASAAIGLALTAAVWVAVVDDPEGGRSVATTQIESDEPSATGSVTAPTAAPRTPSGGESSVAQLPVMPNTGVQAPAVSGGQDTQGALQVDALIETTSFGPLPVIGPDGLRALDAYSRRPTAGPGDNIPRVAIVVGGLGISQTGTQRAIQTLPPDVSLAFAAHGGSLSRWVGMARRDGHETLLQIPMEPFGYPQTDPGPNTLVINGDDLANAERLNASLGRITGYVGVINHMGGRFSSDSNAMRWLLTEIADRGLMYVDSGRAPRSLAIAVGAAIGAPVVKTNLVIDRVRTPGQVARSLKNLEEMARSEGVAVGFASAFPSSVSAIADWAESARDRGVAVVPVSSALAR